MQVMKYIYSLSMVVPSSAYLLQPFILKLILRGPSQSILGCFAGCGWGYVCGETCITGEHMRATLALAEFWELPNYMTVSNHGTGSMVSWQRRH